MSNYQAITLKVKDYKDYDKLLTCLVQDLGKINVILENHKSNIDYSLVEPMCLVDLAIAKIPNTDCLYYLSQGKQIRGYKNIRNSQLKVAYTIYFFNLVSNLIDYCETESGTFELLKGYLNLVSLVNDKDLKLYNSYMSLKLIKILGLGEQPKWCFNCEKEISEYIYLDNKGLAYCGECINNIKNVKISKIKWNLLINTKITDLTEIKLNDDEIKAIELYIIGLIGKEVQGYKYLNLIRN